MVALRAFLSKPPPRNLETAEPEVRRFWHEYARSAPLSRRIVEGIIVVPASIFMIVGWVQVALGRAYVSDALGTTLGIAFGLGLFVILPIRLFFRAMQRRNRKRLDAVMNGHFTSLEPRSVVAIMHSAGDGHARPAWEVWLSLPDGGPRPYLRLALPRTDAALQPSTVEVSCGSTGDVLVLWEPAGVHMLVPVEQRRRARPNTPNVRAT